MAGLSAAVLGVGAIAFTGFFAWHYSHGYADRQRRIDEERVGTRTTSVSAMPRQTFSTSLVSGRRRASDSRQGFAASPRTTATKATMILSGLGDEFDAIAKLLQRQTGSARRSASRPCCPTSPRRPTATA